MRACRLCAVATYKTYTTLSLSKSHTQRSERVIIVLHTSSHCPLRVPRALCGLCRARRGGGGGGRTTDNAHTLCARARHRVTFVRIKNCGPREELQTGCYSRLPPWPCSLPPLQYFHSLLNLFHTLSSSDLLPVRHRPTHPSMVSAGSTVATAPVPAAPMQHDTHRSNSRQQVPCSACSSQPSQLKRPRCAAPQQPSGSSCSR